MYFFLKIKMKGGMNVHHRQAHHHLHHHRNLQHRLQTRQSRHHCRCQTNVYRYIGCKKQNTKLATHFVSCRYTCQVVVASAYFVLTKQFAGAEVVPSSKLTPSISSAIVFSRCSFAKARRCVARMKILNRAGLEPKIDYCNHGIAVSVETAP